MWSIAKAASYQHRPTDRPTVWCFWSPLSVISDGQTGKRGVFIVCAVTAHCAKRVALGSSSSIPRASLLPPSDLLWTATTTTPIAAIAVYYIHIDYYYYYYFILSLPSQFRLSSQFIRLRHELGKKNAIYFYSIKFLLSKFAAASNHLFTVRIKTC